MGNDTLLSELLKSEASHRARDLLRAYSAANAGRALWRPVGNRQNDSATIQAASYPARALIERITNGLDAVIERAHRSHGGKPECRLLKDAASAWFGVP